MAHAVAVIKLVYQHLFLGVDLEARILGARKVSSNQRSCIIQMGFVSTNMELVLAELELNTQTVVLGRWIKTQDATLAPQSVLEASPVHREGGG